MTEKSESVFKVEYNLRAGKFIIIVIEEYTHGTIDGDNKTEIMASFHNMTLSFKVNMNWIEEPHTVLAKDWSFSLVIGEENLITLLKKLIVQSNPEISDEMLNITVNTIIDQARSVRTTNVSPFN